MNARILFTTVRMALWPALLAGLAALQPAAAQERADAPPAVAQAPKEGEPEKKDASLRPEDVFKLPLEQLGNVPARAPATGSFQTPVSSVTRSLDIPLPTAGAAPAAPSATVGASPAAVYVITAEDIERSGQRTIPDLLRMVPGLEVARIDANKWAVSSRGFNNRFANKLLVQMDGRTLYTPLFAGVFWDERDTLLADIQRIEVIRGPGATLWGSNAVNGIISIVTKPASETQGWLMEGGSATDQSAQGFIRYGGQVNKDLHYRWYLKYFDWDNGYGPQGQPGFDGWDQLRGGFRMDWKVSDDGSLMVQGDLFQGRLGDTLTTPTLAPPFTQTVDEQIDIGGGFFLARYDHVLSKESNLSLRFFYDRTHRSEFMVGEDRDILDLDFQHRFPIGERHDLIYGWNYRYTTDGIRNSFGIEFDPRARGDHQFSCFVQDDVALVKDRLHFIFGSKFEYNDYTGFEMQPSTRLLWTPSERQTVWGAISRAVRIPSRADENIRVAVEAIPPGVAPLPLVPTFLGNPTLPAETVIAYEAGYRVSPTEKFQIDLAAFFNDYDDLRSIAPPGPPILQTSPFPYLLLPIPFGDQLYGETYGVELAASWQVAEYWKLHAGYTWLQVQLHAEPGTFAREAEEGTSPHNQFNLRSYLDLTPTIKFDTGLYYVDNLPALNIPHYLRLDARIAWQPRSGFEAVLGFQNLLDPRHLEFRQEFPNILSTEAERVVYGFVRLKY
ncbi:MAG: TonB-dependent receptor [Planctomycetia bacterium]|nr:TonB-dependent receptor [Planctomycetia bacterium]